MRCILLILDGLGDRGHAAFAGQTPLQMASTPNLDQLAALGMTGLYHPWLLGTALPSEIAHFLLFGYDLEDFPGRGYIEALGENLPMEDTDVALLGRIFAVKKQRGLFILTEEDPQLDDASCMALQEAVHTFPHQDVTISFVPTGGIKGIVLLKGQVSAAITDSNPIYEGRPLMEVLPLEGHEQDARAQHTAQALNSYLRWSHRQLSAHPLNRQRKRLGLAPLNAVGLQRAGQKKPVVPFFDKWGFKSLAIATGCLFRGLTQHLGMEALRVEVTDDAHADLLKRLKLAHKAKGYDFVYVHTKVPDEAAHTKDPLIKKEAVETLDRVLAFALEEIVKDPETLLVITADHATNSAGAMIHSGEAVPLLMVGKYTWRDQVTRFDEVSCSRGSLGLVRGKELMLLILNFMDRGKLVGLRDSPWDQPYFPGKFKPLKVK
jgi:2,3-bisphosphoglycerate-independent phosphoglycerate mutase